VELELVRVGGTRGLYAIAGVGTLRVEGILGRSAVVEADGIVWRVARRGLFGSDAEATVAGGIVVGRFEANALRRGGVLRWDERELTLCPASSWRERYAVADGHQELAVLEGKGWGRRPVRILVEDKAAINAGLLLFAAFVVRGLAEDATSGSAVVSSTAAMG